MRPLLAPLVILLAVLATPAVAAPVLPCAGAAPEPPFPPPGQPPVIQVFDDPAGWSPPACLSWQPGHVDLLVALAGTVNDVGSTDELLTRLGAISRQTTIRYWSTSDRAWDDLVVKASALESLDPTRTRTDFSAAELQPGTDHFFVQTDNRSSDPVVYRLRVQAATPDRLVVEIANVTPITAYLMTLFAPGDLRSAYILDRRSATTWNYYSLTSAEGGFLAKIATGHAASFANRAVALYRYVAGQQTDADPPAMR